MRLLAIETATEACSAALFVNGEASERYEVIPRGHGDLLLPMIDELMAAAELHPQQLDGIAFGRGPGAFTGLRIAASVTQGIAFGADLPVVPVSTLATLAQGAFRTSGRESLLTAIDARMGEVYWGAFHIVETQARLVGEECVAAPTEVSCLDGHDWYGCGTGWASYENALNQRYAGTLQGVVDHHLPHARDVATLALPRLAAGDVISAEQAIPVYLRDRVVME